MVCICVCLLCVYVLSCRWSGLCWCLHVCVYVQVVRPFPLLSSIVLCAVLSSCLLILCVCVLFCFVCARVLCSCVCLSCAQEDTQVSCVFSMCWCLPHDVCVLPVGALTCVLCVLERVELCGKGRGKEQGEGVHSFL